MKAFDTAIRIAGFSVAAGIMHHWGISFERSLVVLVIVAVPFALTSIAPAATEDRE